MKGMESRDCKAVLRRRPGKDYRHYVLDWRENLLWLAAAAGMTCMISWLFYRSVYALALFVPMLFLTRRLFSGYFLAKQKSELRYQFGEMLQMIAASLKAGYSMENAFLQAWKEYVRLYGEKSLIAQEFCAICHQLQFNEPLEQLVDDLAQRSGVEEIISFSQVFSFAKRGGGDMMKIFQSTVEKIRQKSDVEREIVTVITAKRTEQRIMDLVPFGILLYVGLTSPEFLAPLYGNLLGAAVMTVCLLVYAGAFLLAEKILNIRI